MFESLLFRIPSMDLGSYPHSFFSSCEYSYILSNLYFLVMICYFISLFITRNSFAFPWTWHGVVLLRLYYYERFNEPRFMHSLHSQNSTKWRLARRNGGSLFRLPLVCSSRFHISLFDHILITDEEGRWILPAPEPYIEDHQFYLLYIVYIHNTISGREAGKRNNDITLSGNISTDSL